MPPFHTFPPVRRMSNPPGSPPFVFSDWQGGSRFAKGGCPPFTLFPRSGGRRTLRVHRHSSFSRRRAGVVLRRGDAPLSHFPPGQAGVEPSGFAAISFFRGAEAERWLGTREEARGRLGTLTSGQFSRWGPAPLREAQRDRASLAEKNCGDGLERRPLASSPGGGRHRYAKRSKIALDGPKSQAPKAGGQPSGFAAISLFRVAGRGSSAGPGALLFRGALRPQAGDHDYFDNRMP